MNSTTTCTYGNPQTVIAYGPAGDSNSATYIITNPLLLTQGDFGPPAAGGSRPVAVGGPSYATSTCVTETSSGSSGSCGSSTTSPCYGSQDYTVPGMIASVFIFFIAFFGFIWLIRNKR